MNSAQGAEAAPRVFVSVGTDYHQFDRIVNWLDDWIADQAEPRPRVVFQHGFTRASAYAENIDFMVYDDMIANMEVAAAVIVHGGPATIFEARGQGHTPICVPRSPALGEHVDGHQERFANHLAADGLVALVQSQAEFVSRLNEQLRGLTRERSAEQNVPAQAAMTELQAIVDRLTPGRVKTRRRLARSPLSWARDVASAPRPPRVRVVAGFLDSDADATTSAGLERGTV